jgi:hypothetical protein
MYGCETWFLTLSVLENGTLGGESLQVKLGSNSRMGTDIVSNLTICTLQQILLASKNNTGETDAGM